MKKILPITLLFCTLFIFGQVPTTERDALIALYNATDGANWTNNTNWNTAQPVSSWFGVTITTISGQSHVTAIELPNNNLIGAIPNGLDALTQLKKIVLKNNSLINQIPDDICNITTLEYINLGGNPTLTDYVPANIGNLTNLTYLSLYANNFSSELPSSFTNLTSLEVLSIGGNQFSNEILDVSSFSNFLGFISIDGNLFSKIDLRNGNNQNFIFTDFTGCPNLTCIFVDDATYSATNWTGIDGSNTFVNNETECDALFVPTTERDALIALYNATDGANWTNNTNWNTAQPVSSWFGVTVATVSGQSHVTEILFNNNNLNGSLPAEIGDLSELTNLDIVFNSLLTGNIPSQIGNLSKLQSLSFWDNDFTGNIPSELGNCTSLTVLSLEDNQLTGNIPASFSNLTAMFSFWVNGNKLSGDVPDIFAGWTDLFYFSIGNGNGTVNAHNDFTGSVDLSNNTALSLCWVDNTMISSLNVQNGNNTNIANGYFIATNNPNLTCVFVDDATYSTTNWTNIDATSTFVETQAACDALYVNEISLEDAINIYPNPAKDNITIANNSNNSIDQISIYNALGKMVYNTFTTQNSIDISNFNTGIYLVQFNSNKKTVTKKLIIQK